jgi:hypothetical protein
VAREYALNAMYNITFGGPEVKKGMFEYEGLMSCLVKVRKWTTTTTSKIAATIQRC